MIDMELYEAFLREASQFKAAAESIVLSDAPFNAAQWRRIVAYHKAADFELRALNLLNGTPPETVANHLFEAIALYDRAEDPMSARHYLSKLQSISEQLQKNKHIQDAVEAITPRIIHNYVLYDSQVKKIPIAHKFYVSPFEDVDLNFFDKILKRFRGVWNLWQIRYFIATRLTDTSTAEESLSRARELSPDNEQLKATAMVAYADITDAGVALQKCRDELKGWETSSSVLNLTFAIAVLRAHRSRIKKLTLKEVIDAVLRAKELSDPEADEVLTLIATSFSIENFQIFTPIQKIEALMRLVASSDNSNVNFQLSVEASSRILRHSLITQHSMQ